MAFPFDLNFTKDYERAGEWWSPLDPSHRVPGRLRYSPETGINIECSGQLLRAPGQFFAESEIVHGEIEYGDPGDPVTLFHASGAFVGAGKTQVVSAGSMLIGKHVESFDAPVTGVNLMLENLNDWISSGPFNYGSAKYASEEKPVIRYFFEVDMEQREPWHVPYHHAKVSIGKSIGQGGQGHSITLTQEQHIRMDFDSPVTLNLALQIIHKFELLLSLLAGWPSLIQAITFAYVDSGQPRQMNYVFNRTAKSTGDRMFARQFMPAPFETIHEQLGTIVDRWFALCDTYAPVIKLLKASLFQPGPSFLEDRFLTVAQAIEGYCRISRSEHFLSDVQFSPIREKLLNDLPADLPARLLELAKGRISGLNEYSLKDRLASLFDRHEWLRCVLIRRNGDEANSSDIDAFIKSVRDTRNGLTHVESAKRRDITVNYSIYWQLRATLIGLLLNDAGFRFDQSSSAKTGIQYQMWWR